MEDVRIVPRSRRNVSRRRFIRDAVAAGAAATATGGPFPGSHAQAQSGGIRRFDHVALPMQDTAAMISFYSALGLQVNENAQRMSVHFGDQKINFHRPESWQRETMTLRGLTAKPGCGDLCFVWEGTPEALKATLGRAGAKIIAGPGKRDGGRNGGKDSGTSVYVRDPDANLLEFMIY